MNLEIVKLHGTANDFLLIDDLDDQLELDDATVVALCDRRRGVGADGLIRVAPYGTSVFMDYRNHDGSAPEMCGNGIRCLAKYCFDRGILTGSGATVGTRAGDRHVSVHRDADGKVTQVEVDMGRAILAPGDIPVDGLDGPHQRVDLDVDGTAMTVHAIGMGNPHAVMWVDDAFSAPVCEIGPRIERHPRFPRGVNVEFAAVRDRGRIDMRVWERGCGETLACGTGACAAAVAGVVTDRTDRSVEVDLRGGTLRIDVGDDTVIMTGPAVEVFATSVDTARF